MLLLSAFFFPSCCSFYCPIIFKNISILIQYPGKFLGFTHEFSAQLWVSKSVCTDITCQSFAIESHLHPDLCPRPLAEALLNFLAEQDLQTTFLQPLPFTSETTENQTGLKIHCS